MSKTNIEWAGKTWNTIGGCTWKSPGCDNCYAASMSLRLESMALAKLEKGEEPGRASKYIGVSRKRSSDGVPVFNGTINLDYNALRDPVKWQKPTLIFVNSMSDTFHPDVPDEFVLEMHQVMEECQDHVFMVLTKRPDRAADFYARHYLSQPPENVAVGTSVENQQQANLRIPQILKINATTFLSCEPLLGPLELTKVKYDGVVVIDCLNGLAGAHVPHETFPGETVKNAWPLNLVIAGGESGPNARSVHPDWVRKLRDDCVDAGTAFFFKQWGEWLPRGQYSANYEPNVPLPSAPHDPAFDRFGKKAAGRVLDGRIWSEMPHDKWYDLLS